MTKRLLQRGDVVMSLRDDIPGCPHLTKYLGAIGVVCDHAFGWYFIVDFGMEQCRPKTQCSRWIFSQEELELLERAVMP